MLKTHTGFKSIRLVFIVLLLLFFINTLAAILLTAQGTNTQDIPIQPNEEIQALLNGLLSTNKQEMFSGTEETFRQQLEQLRYLANTNTEIVVQLLYFSIHANSMQESMLPGIIIKQMGISKADVATALLPLLGTGNKVLRDKAYNWLGEIVLEARVRIEPEVLTVSPGILTAFVRLPDGYPVTNITSATCDGASPERMMPNDDQTEMIIKFRRQDIEAALARKGEKLDTNFVVRGTWEGTVAGNSFEGTASITKIVGAKQKK